MMTAAREALVFEHIEKLSAAHEKLREWSEIPTFQGKNEHEYVQNLIKEILHHHDSLAFHGEPYDHELVEELILLLES